MSRRSTFILASFCFAALLFIAIPMEKKTPPPERIVQVTNYVEKEVCPLNKDSCSAEAVANISVCDELSRPHKSMCHSEYKIPLKVKDDSFTLLVMTHNRWFLLYNILPHYTKMKSLSRVVILWYNPGIEPPKNLTNARYTNGKELKIHVLVDGYSDLRFQAFPEIQTQAVFSIDDDKMIDLVDMEAAFQVWKKNSYGIVGFVKRGHSKSSNSFLYENVVDNYSIILSSCAFVHREYLRLFHETMPVGMRDFIRSMRNCEDIALNMLISAHCRCGAAVHVKPHKKIVDKGPKTEEFSLHERPSHYKDRSQCITHFQQYFSTFPLKTIRSKCDNAVKSTKKVTGPKKRS